MTVTIETFTVSTADLFGFSPPVTGGYHDQIGSGDSISNGDLTVFGGQNVRGLYWAQSTVTFEVYGVHENAGFDYINFGNTTYPRSNATYSVTYTTTQSSSQSYSVGGPYTSWSWAASSFPFSAQNSTETINIQNDGYAPAYGSIDLNAIHREAGGSSGTQGSINDSDVRAKSWYATVKGATPASGATQKFTDFYFPTTVGEDQGYQLRRVPNNSTAWSTERLALVSGGTSTPTNTPFIDKFIYHVDLYTDGTHTYIKLYLYTEGAAQTKTYYDYTDTANTYSSIVDVVKMPNVVVTEAALKTTFISGSTNATYGSINTSKTPTSGVLMTSNSTTSFQTISSNNTRYGRGVEQTHTIPLNAPNGIYSSSYVTRFEWRLRFAPDETRCYVDKGENSLNFLVSGFVTSEKF